MTNSEKNMFILGDDVSSEVVLGAFSGITCGVKDLETACILPDTACTTRDLVICELSDCIGVGCVYPDTSCGLDCTGNTTTNVKKKIATNNDLKREFNVTNGGALCVTKSRAISLGLTVQSGYLDKQLVPLKAISTATATAATWYVTLDIVLSHTKINIDSGLYGAGDGYLAPMNYSRPTTYASSVSSPYFNFRTFNNFVSFEENMAYGRFREYYTPANLVPGGSNYSVAQVDSEEVIGVLENTFNSNTQGGFNILLYMKDYNGNFVAAGLYHDAAWASIRATGINLKIDGTGVSLPDTQSSGCVVRLVEDSSSIDSSGQGYFSGRLYLDSLQF